MLLLATFSLPRSTELGKRDSLHICIFSFTSIQINSVERLRVMVALQMSLSLTAVRSVTLFLSKGTWRRRQGMVAKVADDTQGLRDILTLRSVM